MLPRGAIDRKIEFEMIGSAVEQAAQGRGRVLLIEGHRGVGKSTLLAEAARRAGERGFTVASGRGRAGELAAPGSTLRHAIIRCAPSMTEWRDFGELIANLLSLAPLALVLDDAHLADEMSLRILEELADRIVFQPVLVAIAGGPRLSDRGRPPAFRALRGREHVTAIALRALDEVGATKLIRATLPDADRRFCSESAELTGGNPFLLSELTAWIGAHRVEPVAGAARQALEPVPPLTMREFVRKQLDDVDTDASALAAAIAISDRPLRLEQAARLVGFDRSRTLRAIDALLENGVITPGEELSFTAPVTALCLQTETPDSLVADLRRRLAELSADADGRGDSSTHHLLLAPPTGNQEVVDRLIELADGEVAGGKLDRARKLIRRALAEHAGRPSSSPHLVARLGVVDLLEGRSGSTSTLAAAVAALEVSRDRADALLKLGVSQVAGGAPRAAARSFDAARDLVDDADPLRWRAEMSCLLTRLLIPEARGAAAGRIGQLVRDGELVADPHGAELLMAHAWQRLCEGHPFREVASLAGRALALRRTARPSINGYFDATAAVLFATVDDFERAHDICDGCATSARDHGLLLAEGNIEFGRAVALLHQGRLADAAEHARGLLSRADDSQRFHDAEAAGILASALHEQGCAEEASQIVADALRRAPADEPRSLLLLEAGARAALDTGDLGEALRLVAEAETLAIGLGVVNPALVAWQPTAALAYHAVGQTRRAQALTDDAFEAAERFGLPRGIALALRTKAEIEGPPSAIDDLRAALDAIEESDAELERAKVLLAYGTALHRDGRDDVARGPLRDGIGLADRLGARSIARQGLETLRAAGGRPRRLRMAGPEALTPAERQVVDLAVGGATNREIAEALVITRKTVEWHLKKVFVKLDVSSREQLRGAMESQLVGSRDSQI
jgi:DNA-binding CsgD family transcriptional regulator/tetratricopeptide (TPR) repeat protein